MSAIINKLWPNLDHGPENSKFFVELSDHLSKKNYSVQLRSGAVHHNLRASHHLAGFEQHGAKDMTIVTHYAKFHQHVVDPREVVYFSIDCIGRPFPSSWIVKVFDEFETSSLLENWPFCHN